MKFDYYKDVFSSINYHFKFSLTENEIRKLSHKYGWASRDVDNYFSFLSVNDDYKIYASLELLKSAIDYKTVNLGIDYKQKYEELEELLKPYQIEDNMSPSTTLKIILKYLPEK